VWDEIGSVRGLMERPWAVCGDFSVCRFPYEKKECNRLNSAMREFSECIEDMDLIDLQLSGGRYTWYKGDNHITASRLDRIMVSTEWNNLFTNIKQTTMQRVTSDHVPIALLCGHWEQSKSYFKFENWWLNQEGFVERIKVWWNDFEFYGKPDYILACKLKALKGKLKEWSRYEQGNLKLQKNNLLNQMAVLESHQSNRILTEEEIEKKPTLFMEYEGCLKNEEVAWRQRSRALWLKEGDRNTKFFHQTANAHKRYNHIDQLEVQGENITEPNRIKEEIISFYKKMYIEPEGWRPSVNISNHPTITVGENEALQADFEEQEVLECLKMCAIDKAPMLMDTQWFLFFKMLGDH